MGKESKKYVYFFGKGMTEGSADMKALLGGKGANLADMTSIGLPVPPGFTITTEACAYFDQHKGYPEGLSGEDIPLAARIMAISDVFDAVSEKRCYRDALPLDACFEIIKNGSGTDFDPLLVEVFLDIRDKVEATFHQIS